MVHQKRGDGNDKLFCRTIFLIMSQFKIFGYSVDFYQNKKLVGSLILDKADREEIGYAGRKVMSYKGQLKKGHKFVEVDGEFMTECFPLCGRIMDSKLDEI